MTRKQISQEVAHKISTNIQKNILQRKPQLFDNFTLFMKAIAKFLFLFMFVSISKVDPLADGAPDARVFTHR